MLRFEILNEIAARIGARRYLEIGVQDGVAFRAVAVRTKVGVDPEPRSAATVHATSDEYFAALPAGARFDLVFVDGLHTADQVAIDIHNAMRHLSKRGAIVVHDCNPPNEHWATRTGSPLAPGWCGDVYRGWVRSRIAHPNWFHAVVDTDLGCGVITRGGPHAVPVPAPREVEPSTWREFEADRGGWLNTITVEQFRALVAGMPPGRGVLPSPEGSVA